VKYRLASSFSTALRPFETKLFGLLWISFLLANSCMWMFDSTATWLLVGQGASPFLIALVQTASTLPVFLLGLPSGALADFVDRKKLYLFTQAWLGLVACSMVIVIEMGSISPWMILFLTFINGIGLSLRWPVYASLVPLVLPPKSLQQAFALNSAAMNLSRILGPALAGWLLLQLSSTAVYLVIALISGLIFLLLLRSDLPDVRSKVKRPSFLNFIKEGVINSFSHRQIRQVLVLISLFFFAGISVVALAAVVALTRMGVNPLSYALLLSSIGLGAVVSVFLIPLINDFLDEKKVFWLAIVGQAMTVGLLSITHSPALIFCLFFLSGFLWVVVVSLLTVSIQLSLTHAFRARGMAIYQLCLMGASALGAAAWGGLATAYGLTVTFFVSGLTVLACLIPVYPVVAKQLVASR
jgi:predicted MFS family arabinose efflux permease